MLEAAIITPLLLMLTFSIVDFGAIFYVYLAEGPQSDVKGNKAHIYTLYLKALHELFRKVQTSSGC